MKLALLLVYSICAFAVSSWAGLGVLCVALALAVAAGKVPVARLALLSAPLLFMLAIIWVCNAFTLDASATAQSGLLGASAGFAQGWQPIVLWGSFAFLPDGCMRGLFYAVRILLIFLASFVLAFTTTAEALTEGFSRVLKPLRALRVPVDDIATMLSLAVRFIPVMAAELSQLKAAQRSRGARFDSGSLMVRLRAWGNVLFPLFVGMFRRADRVALAMEARCYGFGPRSALNYTKVGALQGGFACTATVALVAVAVLL